MNPSSWDILLKESAENSERKEKSLIYFLQLMRTADPLSFTHSDNKWNHIYVEIAQYIIRNISAAIND